MIREIRKIIMENSPVAKLFNKLGGIDYAIYERKNIIESAGCIDYFVTFDGAKYKVDEYSNYTVKETRLEYDWSDIRSDDIVLDLGANIGGFTIGSALKAKHVYAVEPLFYKELEGNVKLNELSNVTIFPFAIGDKEGTIDLSYNKVERKNIPTYSFTNLVNMIQTLSNNQHKVSFLKCDCEGGEWYIKLSDLDGIRRIEMEIHPKMYPTISYNPELIPYIKQHWSVNLTNEDRHNAYVLHARRV